MCCTEIPIYRNLLYKKYINGERNIKNKGWMEIRPVSKSNIL